MKLVDNEKVEIQFKDQHFLRHNKFLLIPEVVWQHT